MNLVLVNNYHTYTAHSSLSVQPYRLFFLAVIDQTLPNNVTLCINSNSNSKVNLLKNIEDLS